MKILKFPLIRQTFAYDCGAKALESILVYFGYGVRGEAVMKAVETSKKAGTPPENIIRAVKKYGLQSTAKKMTINDLKKYIDKNIPVIIVMQAWSKKKTDWKSDWKDGHYVVTIGYDKNKIYFADPSSTNIAYLTYSELMERWHDISTSGKKYINYGIAIYGKKPKYNTRRFVHMD